MTNNLSEVTAEVGEDYSKNICDELRYDLDCDRKYFAIFKSFIFTLDHLLTLTHPSRLSICDRRSLSALRSDPW
ncbi:MAG: hypothetical protein KJP23_07830 [Deltaproteobacteria bacterium]|nr:hypothetical protein [Deltaproteobacteria bacterium]